MARFDLHRLVLFQEGQERARLHWVGKKAILNLLKNLHDPHALLDKLSKVKTGKV